MARELAQVFTVAAARSNGYTYKRLRHENEKGDLVQLRRGVYCTRDTWARANGDKAFRHALHVAAAMVLLDCPSWACGFSAAQLYGWPVPLREPRQVSLAVEPGSAPSRIRDSGVRIFPTAVPQAHRARLFGVPLLTKPRTIVDIARRHGLAAGLVVADATRRNGDVYAKPLDAAVDACRGWPGIQTARLVAKYASRDRESPLESKSFALFVENGIPLPVCNPWLGGYPKRIRVDFLWEKYRIVGEADGRVKYLDPDLERESVLWQEKLRSEAIEDLGYVVTRWTGQELERSPEVVIERLFRASRRAHKLFGVPLLG